MPTRLSVSTSLRWAIPALLLVTVVLGYVANSRNVVAPPPLSNDEELVSDSSALLAEARLPLREGTFAYLVMGPYVPDPVWVRSSARPEVSVIFLAWHHHAMKARVNLAKISARTGFSNFSLSIFHYPNCTWAQGRNSLYQLTLEQEETQGWKFEYVIFFDDDVRLLYRHGIANTSVVRNHHTAERKLLHRVMRDRPARASVENSAYFLYYKLQCVRNCAFDAAVDIFHRTLLDHFMPYPTEFDKKNWWMSSETMSYRSAVLSPQYCNLYRNIVVDTKVNAHRQYPKAALKTFQDDAIDAFLSCLDKRHYSEFEGDAITVLQHLKTYGLHRPMPTDKTPPCTEQSAGVDYSIVLQEDLKTWPRECLL